MQMRAIIGRIAYKRGVILAARFDGEEPPEAACQVVRFDRGFLLVRIEDEADFLQVGVDVELEVPSEEALYRLEGRVEQIAGRERRHTYRLHGGRRHRDNSTAQTVPF